MMWSELPLDTSPFLLLTHIQRDILHEVIYNHRVVALAFINHHPCSDGILSFFPSFPHYRSSLSTSSFNLVQALVS
ncbi:hypothetical protein PNOK_0529600 [Pyrrhoderma noxium]|uniref:Uncharacterized protein n=1 Tax=Pyrrhoderma noxium TaxID=2282107 RepID=A0A286UG39_9AGAM|nr:hypothetical protein PNOK_0529600 [Pyrrhoderma noxium]